MKLPLSGKEFEDLPYQEKQILETQAIQAVYHRWTLTDTQHEALMWRLRMVNRGDFEHLDKGERFHVITNPGWPPTYSGIWR